MGKIKYKMPILILLLGLLISLPASAYSFDDYNSYEKSKLQNYTVIEYLKNINTIKLYNFVGDSTQGLTDFYNKRIILRQSVDSWKNTHVFHHECGHVFDTEIVNGNPVYHYYSESTEFRSIWAKERNSIISYTNELYVTVDIHEYFAESFSWYYENPTKLKSTSPLTYAYLDKVYNDILHP